MDDNLSNIDRIKYGFNHLKSALFFVMLTGYINASTLVGVNIYNSLKEGKTTVEEINEKIHSSKGIEKIIQGVYYPSIDVACSIYEKQKAEQ